MAVYGTLTVLYTLSSGQRTAIKNLPINTDTVAFYNNLSPAKGNTVGEGDIRIFFVANWP